MRLLLVKVLAFLLVNILLFPVHVNAFQSPWPFLAWFTLVLHAVTLLLFPYFRFFKITHTQ